jgi:hypothetical protein
LLHRFIASAVAASLLFASAARAEPPVKDADADADRYEWRFDDDPLHSAGTNPYGEWLGVRRPAPHAMLIRPRTSFVFELLASIGRL